LSGTPEWAGSIIDKAVKSKFDIFFLNEIKQVKLGDNGWDHNKLRFYNKLKGSFKMEPYIDKIKNRNQRQCTMVQHVLISLKKLFFSNQAHTILIFPAKSRVNQWWRLEII